MINLKVIIRVLSFIVLVNVCANAIFWAGRSFYALATFEQTAATACCATGLLPLFIFRRASSLRAKLMTGGFMIILMVTAACVWSLPAMRERDLHEYLFTVWFGIATLGMGAFSLFVYQKYQEGERMDESELRMLKLRYRKLSELHDLVNLQETDQADELCCFLLDEITQVEALIREQEPEAVLEREAPRFVSGASGYPPRIAL